MKHLFHFLGSLLRFAVISLILACLYGGIRYLLWLVSMVEKPTWGNVMGMALVVWIALILYGAYSVVKFALSNDRKNYD